ncbi:unnamed protein product [Brachionus calyciflorus]|uniref:Uncharacterized protein n=1 Tax=Brachionus calyciflorus TaxID=104777 RepID=A0A814J466_9BILA|nr:unnamed protein product [Brachionus calyciflorus]
MSFSLTSKQSKEIACKNFYFMVGVVKAQFELRKVFDHFDELSCLLIVENTNESDDDDLFNILLTAFFFNERPKAIDDTTLFKRNQIVKFISDENDKINNTGDYLEVDTIYKDHKITPEIKHYFQIGALKIPVWSKNELIGEKETTKTKKSITMGDSHYQ